MFAGALHRGLASRAKVTDWPASNPSWSLRRPSHDVPPRPPRAPGPRTRLEPLQIQNVGCLGRLRRAALAHGHARLAAPAVCVMPLSLDSDSLAARQRPDFTFDIILIHRTADRAVARILRNTPRAASSRRGAPARTRPLASPKLMQGTKTTIIEGCGLRHLPCRPPE